MIVPLFCESLFWASQSKQAAKITQQPMPPATQAVVLLLLNTQQGGSSIILAMTRRDVGKHVFSRRKKMRRENTCTIADSQSVKKCNSLNNGSPALACGDYPIASAD